MLDFALSSDADGAMGGLPGYYRIWNWAWGSAPLHRTPNSS